MRASSPSTAPAHTVQSSATAVPCARSMTASGVYVPAMTRKMFEWSARRSAAVTRGDQVPRW